MRARSASSSACLRAAASSSSALGEWSSEWSGIVSDAVIGESSSSSSLDSACCGALSHIYASQPFREWWDGRGRSGAERLQWLDYRAKGVDLIEYLRENHRSMKVLERSLEQRLHAIWAAEPPSTSPTKQPHARPDEVLDASDAATPDAAATRGSHRRTASEPSLASPSSPEVTSTRRESGAGAALA